ncbi:MAG: hypothetical protein ACLVJQ_05485, partial [Lentihominibacter sp.]
GRDMSGSKVLIVLFIDFVFLYTGCTFDSGLMKMIGGICLLLLAFATVLPIKGKNKEGGKRWRRSC